MDGDVDAPGGELAVADDEATGQALGYVTMKFDREALIGWIHNLAVSSEARNRGLGRQLGRPSTSVTRRR